MRDFKVKERAGFVPMILMVLLCLFSNIYSTTHNWDGVSVISTEPGDTVRVNMDEVSLNSTFDVIQDNITIVLEGEDGIVFPASLSLNSTANNTVVILNPDADLDRVGAMDYSALSSEAFVFSGDSGRVSEYVAPGEVVEGVNPYEALEGSVVLDSSIFSFSGTANEMEMLMGIYNRADFDSMSTYEQDYLSPVVSWSGLGYVVMADVDFENREYKGPGGVYYLQSIFDGGNKRLYNYVGFTEVPGASYKYGFIGFFNQARIRNIYLEGEQKVESTRSAMLGHCQSSEVENVHILGEVKGYQWTGGVFSEVNRCTVRNLEFAGSVVNKSSSFSTMVGGFSPHVQLSTIQRVSISGLIQADRDFGGFVAQSYSSTYKDIAVYSYLEQNQFGLSGGSNISGWKTGGFLGWSTKTDSLENVFCYSGISNPNILAAGIFGLDTVGIETSNVYWSKERAQTDSSSHGSTPDVQTLDSVSLFQKSSYAFDFDNTWDMEEGEGLPYLRGMKFRPPSYRSLNTVLEDSLSYADRTSEFYLDSFFINGGQNTELHSSSNVVALQNGQVLSTIRNNLEPAHVLLRTTSSSDMPFYWALDLLDYTPLHNDYDSLVVEISDLNKHFRLKGNYQTLILQSSQDFNLGEFGSVFSEGVGNRVHIELLNEHSTIQKDTMMGAQINLMGDSSAVAVYYHPGSIADSYSAHDPSDSTENRFFYDIRNYVDSGFYSLGNDAQFEELYFIQDGVKDSADIHAFKNALYSEDRARAESDIQKRGFALADDFSDAEIREVPLLQGYAFRGVFDGRMVLVDGITVRGAVYLTSTADHSEIRGINIRNSVYCTQINYSNGFLTQNLRNSRITNSRIDVKSNASNCPDYVSTAYVSVVASDFDSSYAKNITISSYYDLAYTGQYGFSKFITSSQLNDIIWTGRLLNSNQSYALARTISNTELSKIVISGEVGGGNGKYLISSHIDSSTFNGLLVNGLISGDSETNFGALSDTMSQSSFTDLIELVLLPQNTGTLFALNNTGSSVNNAYYSSYFSKERDLIGGGDSIAAADLDSGALFLSSNYNLSNTFWEQREGQTTPYFNDLTPPISFPDSFGVNGEILLQQLYENDINFNEHYPLTVKILSGRFGYVENGVYKFYESFYQAGVIDTIKYLNGMVLGEDTLWGAPTYGFLTMVEHFNPIAENDSFSLAEEESLEISFDELLVNDSDENELDILAINGALSQGIGYDLSGDLSLSFGIVSFTDSSLVYSTIENAFGSDSLQVVVSDNHGYLDTSWLYIEVRNVNDAPEFSGSLSDEILLEDFAPDTVHLSGLWQDVDGETPQFSFESSLVDSLYTLSVEGDELIFTSVPHRFGEDTSLTIIATDSLGLSDSISLRVVIKETNDPPSFTMPDTLVIYEDNGGFSADSFLTDISAGAGLELMQTVRFSTVVSSPSLFSESLEIDESGRLSFAVKPDSSGTVLVAVTAVDDAASYYGGLLSSQAVYMDTLILQVLPVNDAPVASLRDEGIVRVREDSINVVVEDFFLLENCGPANETQVLQSVTIRQTDSAYFISQPEIEGADLEFSLAPDISGTLNMEVVIFDADGIENNGVDSLVLPFSLVIDAVDDAPYLTVDSLPPLTLLEDFADTFFVLSPYFADREGDSIIYAVSGDEYLNASIPDGRDTLYLRSVMDENISLEVLRISVRNQSSATATFDLNIEIVPVNDAPDISLFPQVLNSSEDQGNVEYPGFYTVNSSGAENENQSILSYGVDADSSYFDVMPVINSSGTLSFTTAADSSGVVELHVWALDAGDTLNGGVNEFRQTVLLNISPENDYPELSETPLPELSLLEDFSDTAISLAPYFTDQEGDEIYFDVDASGILASISGDSLFLSPLENFNGNASVLVYASNDSSIFPVNYSTIDINLTAVNDAPSFELQDTLWLIEDQVFIPQLVVSQSYEGAENEVLNQAVSFEVLEDSVFSPVISSNGYLSLGIPADYYGEFTVAVRARDDGLSDSIGLNINMSEWQEMVVVVFPVNDAPFVSFRDQFNLDEDEEEQLVSNFLRDSSTGANEEQELSFYLIADSSQFQIYPYVDSLNTLHFQVAENVFEDVVFTVVAQDDGDVEWGGVNTYSDDVVISVRGLDDPISLDSTELLMFQEDGSLTVSSEDLYVTDVDGDYYNAFSIHDQQGIIVQGETVFLNETFSVEFLHNAEGDLVAVVPLQIEVRDDHGNTDIAVLYAVVPEGTESVIPVASSDFSNRVFFTGKLVWIAIPQNTSAFKIYDLYGREVHSGSTDGRKLLNVENYWAHFVRFF
jgi:hypothetical protein